MGGVDHHARQPPHHGRTAWGNVRSGPLKPRCRQAQHFVRRRLRSHCQGGRSPPVGVSGPRVRARSGRPRRSWFFDLSFWVDAGPRTAFSAGARCGAHERVRARSGRPRGRSDGPARWGHLLIVDNLSVSAASEYDEGEMRRCTNGHGWTFRRRAGRLESRRGRMLPLGPSVGDVRAEDRARRLDAALVEDGRKWRGLLERSSGSRCRPGWVVHRLGKQGDPFAGPTHRRCLKSPHSPFYLLNRWPRAGCPPKPPA